MCGGQYCLLCVIDYLCVLSLSITYLDILAWFLTYFWEALHSPLLHSCIQMQNQPSANIMRGASLNICRSHFCEL
jgi:hypothetical protein